MEHGVYACAIVLGHHSSELFALISSFYFRSPQPTPTFGCTVPMTWGNVSHALLQGDHCDPPPVRPSSRDRHLCGSQKQTVRRAQVGER